METDEPEDPIKVIVPRPRLRHYLLSSPHVREAGVPRRFGMGTLMLITAMYAVLFAVLHAANFPPMAFVVVALFFTAVGLGQMLLFKGEHPRMASVLTGAGFYAITALVMFGYDRVVQHQGTYPDLGFGLFLFAFSGAIAGYLCGGIIAGVFLLIDKCKAQFEAARRTEEKSQRGEPI